MFLMLMHNPTEECCDSNLGYILRLGTISIELLYEAMLNYKMKNINMLWNGIQFCEQKQFTPLLTTKWT
jgi:hypothetical protein